jgi:hypothetical protein
MSRFQLFTRRFDNVGWAKSSGVLLPRGHGARTILPTRKEHFGARLCPPYLT